MFLLPLDLRGSPLLLGAPHCLRCCSLLPPPGVLCLPGVGLGLDSHVSLLLGRDCQVGGALLGRSKLLLLEYPLSLLLVGHPPLLLGSVPHCLELHPGSLTVGILGLGFVDKEC